LTILHFARHKIYSDAERLGLGPSLKKEQVICMLYDSTRVLLRGILSSLEGAGRIRWEDQVEAAGECSYEMHQMARPIYQGYRSDPVNRMAVRVPVSERAARAVPHVKSMVRAIRRKDQNAAVESGKAALAEL
jgi:hypothetical protein